MPKYAIEKDGKYWSEGLFFDSKDYGTLEEAALFSEEEKNRIHLHGGENWRVVKLEVIDP